MDLNILHFRTLVYVPRTNRLFTILLAGTLIFSACKEQSDKAEGEGVTKRSEEPFLLVLGTVQDAGIPQLGCEKSCCVNYKGVKDPDKNVVSLGLMDPLAQKSFLFEATPDINRQLEIIKQHIPYDNFILPDGIVITHAHIGHYTGLMQLGREAFNANKVPVYSMPQLTSYLENNGPWDQLVSLGNIVLTTIQENSAFALTDQITVTPLQVPHRDEYSETAGFLISGPNKKALFIPDIDKWQQWEMDIAQLIREVDYAFLDATFYDGNEIKNRDMSEIPHPFVVESMSQFKILSPEEKAKVYFIHFNHTNPLLDPYSKAYKKVLEEGYNIAETHQTYPM